MFGLIFFTYSFILKKKLKVQISKVSKIRTFNTLVMNMLMHLIDDLEVIAAAYVGEHFRIHFVFE